MLEVLTPPAVDLVDLEAVKAHLSIEGDDDDAVLSSLITRASAAIVSYLSFNPNQGQYRQTEETTVGQSYVILSRVPVTEVTAVEVDGVALSENESRLDSSSGLLARVAGGRSRPWESRSTVVITYQAGFDEVPGDIQAAALKLVEADYAARGRDPGLRGISIGSINLSYQNPSAAPSVQSVAYLLDPHRAVGIG